MKRYRIKKPKPGQITISFGKLDGQYELVYSYDDSDLPQGVRIGKPTINLLMMVFENVEAHEGRTLIQVLQDRGYDLSTLKLTIDRRTDEGNILPLVKRPIYKLKYDWRKNDE